MSHFLSLLRLSRFAFLFVVITSAAFAAPMNLLIVTVDDMSCDSMGVYGCPVKGTSPWMDSLASQSLRFEHAHVVVGNCMPSRNVMWSGRYPHNNGVEGFYQVPNAKHPHLVDVMQKAGYFTAIRGKVSHSTPYHPYHWDAVLDTLPDGSQAHIKDAKSYGISTQMGIDAATKADKPFCLMINISDPHKPFYAQGKGGQVFDDPHVPSRIFNADEMIVPGFLFDDPQVKQELAHYYSSVRRADDCVGEVLDVLEKSGQADNTVTIFLSDHGMPLPFAKTQVYHHSSRTPLMVRWPGVIKPGTVDTEHMVSAVDLLPTILDILDLASPPKMDGRSFEPILKGKSQPNRDFVIKEYNENSGRSRDPMRAIQTKEFLYIFNPWSNGERIFATATNGTQTYRKMKELAETNSQIHARHELYQHRVVEELYNIADDPDCLVNLIESKDVSANLDYLRLNLERVMQETDDHCLQPFKDRDEPEKLEAYVLAKEKEASERSPRKQKPNRNRNLKFIELHLPKKSHPGGKFIVEIKHMLPKRLGDQKLHVTLKQGKQGHRVERKVISISGSGTAKVEFAVPDKVEDNQLHCAAFVGSEYAENLQHVQEGPVKVSQ